MTIMGRTLVRMLLQKEGWGAVRVLSIHIAAAQRVNHLVIAGCNGRKFGAILESPLDNGIIDDGDALYIILLDFLHKIAVAHIVLRSIGCIVVIIDPKAEDKDEQVEKMFLKNLVTVSSSPKRSGIFWDLFIFHRRNASGCQHKEAYGNLHCNQAKADNKFIGNDKAVIIRHHFHKAPFLLFKHGRKANTLAVTGSEKFTDGF